MSWTNIGPIVELAPGQSAGWDYSWEGSQDMGLQIAGPNYPDDVIYPGDIGTLVASNQGKALQGFAAGGGAAVSYIVTITNISTSESGSHNLQGGTVS